VRDEAIIRFVADPAGSARTAPDELIRMRMMLLPTAARFIDKKGPTERPT
jgi:hypothetical protein